MENVWEKESFKYRINRETTQSGQQYEREDKNMKTGKAPGPSEITAEILETSSGVGYGLITCIVSQVR